MNRRSPVWFPLLLAAGLAAITYWLDQVVSTEMVVRDGKALHEPDYFVDDFRATQMDATGAPRYRVSARKMTHYGDDGSTRLEQLDFQRVGTDAPPVEVHAGVGLMSGDGENLFFLNGVEAWQGEKDSADRIRVESSFLHVMPKLDLVKTDKPVRVTGRGMTLTGTGLELDSKSQVLRLLSNVRAIHEPSY